MSDLTEFRDHCRERADWLPGPCRVACREATIFDTPKPADHVNCGGARCGCYCHAPTDRERDLFARLADEIDAYLTTDHDDQPLDLGGHA